MTADDELCFASAHELAARIRARDLSPVEVADAVIERIERLDPHLVAFCAFEADQVRAAAEEAEQAVMRNEPLGPSTACRSASRT
ncbi:hypothetical protein [Nocardioides humi]|uniref:hypothetical protein n=1 Tax=Nocardioides humi TaxID=449461 RepID=UPI001C640A80|nr:hypothetical protein [Nocardioides humi]